MSSQKKKIRAAAQVLKTRKRKQKCEPPHTKSKNRKRKQKHQQPHKISKIKIKTTGTRAAAQVKCDSIKAAPNAEKNKNKCEPPKK